jgi:hypothetical protein
MLSVKIYRNLRRICWYELYFKEREKKSAQLSCVEVLHVNVGFFLHAIEMHRKRNISAKCECIANWLLSPARNYLICNPCPPRGGGGGEYLLRSKLLFFFIHVCSTIFFNLYFIYRLSNFWLAKEVNKELKKELLHQCL